jgi:predicted neuraminidase
MGTEQLIKTTGRYITKVGNPMLYVDGADLHLWFVSVSLGGWGGSRLNHMLSVDQGNTWSNPRELIASPFLNVSTLVRSTALPALALPQSDSVATERGYAPKDPESKTLMREPTVVSRETLLPAYFELTHKYPLLLRLDAQGQIRDRYPFGRRTGLLQPSVIRSIHKPPAEDHPNPSALPASAKKSKNLPQTELVAFFRRAQAIPEAKVFIARSRDEGLTWDKASPIGIPNGDASIMAWPDGSKIWLVANPNPAHRRSLASFQLPSTGALAAEILPTQILDQVAEAPGHQEFSYPSFATTADGNLHLVYTADGRKTIRHRMWTPISTTSQSPASLATPGVRP